MTTASQSVKILPVIDLAILRVLIYRYYMYGLLTKCEVKMADAKKERGQYQAILTEQTWSIKDFLYGFRGNFSCGTRRVVLSGQDGSILPARVANHSAGFDLSCPLAELAIIIIRHVLTFLLLSTSLNRPFTSDNLRSYKKELHYYNVVIKHL